MLRNMQEADIDAVIAIEKAAHLVPWSEQAFRDSLAADHKCVVSVMDDEIIGFAVMAITLDEAEILNIAVKKDKQQQGFGTNLLRYLLNLASDKKAFLEVRASNLAAIKFYQKFGFSQIAVRKDYYETESGREDAVILKKSYF